MLYLLNKFSLWLAMGNFKRFAGQIRSELMLTRKMGYKDERRW
jgi:hypothetical protein